MSDMNDLWRKLSKLGRYGGYGGLRSWVLYMLGERPMNGAEIMDSMESMSYGAWRPSPGSIYPLLSKMVEEKLITKREDGRYVLASEGYDRINFFGENVDKRPYSVGNILTDFDNYLSYMEDLQKDKVLPYEDKLGRIIERMTRLKESLHK
ncbi:MAG TPA: PadR family transcriptional regulator [Methanocella sp.]|uniref:PadR family transcriptional regulator n=1 Tax=Methanocella sp. TaxID=2052833 RepID=UPI002CE6EE8D|nr:PadR family transcriptional regulator [Methanocella sp.]HTY91772.1 PadR family transcriptional regulator [Methanocella sp.]